MLHPLKGPIVPTFSALKGGVALQVASWKVSRYSGGRSYTVGCHATMGHLGWLSRGENEAKTRFRKR